MIDSREETLHALFEGAPRFVERLRNVDAGSWDELLGRAAEVAHDMPEDEQVELLNAHPRIGARPSSVSELSFREQGYDRDPGTAELQQRLDSLNEEYEHRNGFRFVVFVAGRPRSVIADVLEAHLSAPRDEELDRALSDVISIARDRLTKLFPQPEEVR